MSRRLVAALACRNQSARLYAKPLQNLDIEKGLSVLEYLLQLIGQFKIIDEIVLGISESNENLAFVELAK